ncbi:Protein kinase-like domain protein [Niveomyces insectorum RCEF 264]|uniref:EKC/KEOPS complex subunit BUD32 n=1 Tax=Niveomyces insectorum RCEF 264 TaxID=1081102 RepID=A0A167QTR6_9HYPO|nr:Protein kinase-like domain protein [Niveomyces insectorum RCEF 264]
MSWPTPKKKIPGEILGMGGSCFVSYVDDRTVYKSYEIWVDGKRQSYYPEKCEESIAREAQVYEQLGKHPQILHFYGVEEVGPGVHALRLERAPLGSVRGHIQSSPNTPPPERTRIRMSLDAALGLAHAHAKLVRHCDLSCRNLLLFDDFRVKIGDWAGSLIEGHEKFAQCATWEEMQYELPCRGRDFDDRPVLKREVFALGSAIYEMMAWRRPFQDVPDEEVEKRYAREEFPRLDGIAVAGIISKCWHEVAYMFGRGLCRSRAERWAPARQTMEGIEDTDESERAGVAGEETALLADNGIDASSKFPAGPTAAFPPRTIVAVALIIGTVVLVEAWSLASSCTASATATTSSCAVSSPPWSSRPTAATLFNAAGILESVGTVIAGPLLAAAFRTGLRLDGLWTGLPFFVAAALFGTALVVLATARLPGS